MSTRIQSTINFSDGVNATDNLLNLINEGTQDTKKSLMEAFDFHDKKCGFFDSIWNKCSGCESPSDLMENVKQGKIEDLERLRQKYEYGILKTRQEMADSLLKYSSICSGVLILTEVTRLINIWNSIKSAENFIIERVELQKIEQLIRQMKRQEENIGDLQAKFQAAKSDKTKKKILKRIVDDQTDTRGLILQAQRLIGEAKFSINGKIEILRGHSETLTISLISNMAHLTMNAFQLSNAGGIATLFWRNLACMAWVGLGITAIAEGRTYYVTQEMIKRLRKELSELKGFDLELEKFDEICTKVRAWITEMEDDSEDDEN